MEGNASGSGAYRDVPIDESKKDFWDSFAEAGAQKQKSSAVGTSAIKKAGGGGTGARKDDEWDKW